MGYPRPVLRIEYRRLEMASKYGQFFKGYQAQPEEIARGRTGIARVDYNTFKGCNFYWVHWNLPHAAARSTDMIGVGHPPHTQRRRNPDAHRYQPRRSDGPGSGSGTADGQRAGKAHHDQVHRRLYTLE